MISHSLCSFELLLLLLCRVFHRSLTPSPVSYHQVFFKDASVKQVDVPTLTGAFGILPAHVPTLQVLRPGIVTVFNDDGSSDKYFGKFTLYKI